MSNSPAVLRHADTPEALRACYPVMKQLRPHLQSEAEFLERVARQAAEGYRLLAEWQDDQPVALAGYRLQENLVYGKFLYVDDLITTEAARGSQCGARLLDALGEVAAQSGCVRLTLDTGLANALAQRFYFRQGLLTSSMRFGKAITPIIPVQ
ncbi:MULTISPECIES: GNAT family N-acetyltransferase [unclassified Herbaspirillum]|jgi:GNAT superfamily N-acetyltransferase|uniref:GNAT family N-acetyltransferase n=1 Tax=unclassified Herbaspirillum TaxID=2624150 RepID=UPI000E2E81EB|nr:MULTISPECIES: GNAT family N-acetyltransferase [unclassified Herbaspirillum]RFB69543.1 GNAT family N-acetyltransferase [Herbaspirillum sp. 3R-3a1]TFI07401.1 GNAT family N-acetyltransferase [Herbaspirillum sp. 3R11]TFI12176.1 GNAT family N-acetyltransferase [Herbaspirillum sp. 3R-11]TFI19578.1 GNAT family N-acetyltransferase [Herbaspirillum sp. 3C11]